MKRSEYSKRLQFEHELINRRVTWLLTSQTILFAAYGIVLTSSLPSELFLKTLPVIGAVIAVLVWAGILASFGAKICTWHDFKESGNPNEPFWVRTYITWIGFIPELALPLVFAFAWGYLYFNFEAVPSYFFETACHYEHVY